MSESICECGKRRKCPFRIIVKGAGIVSARSKDILACGKGLKTLERSRLIKLNNPTE
ncbi:hypothetical protein KAR91_71305 [Candidatus Pacearchaeota archaeon]|nr:hypothetical protein [Candidatus Pacearchaeota archaeon]